MAAPEVVPDVVPILRRADMPIALAATANTGKIACLGHKRVFGIYVPTAPTAPAVGFPRVRQSSDGVNYDRMTQTIGLDVFSGTYPFDIALEGSYVSVEWTEAAGGGNLRASAFLAKQ